MQGFEGLMITHTQYFNSFFGEIDYISSHLAISS